MSRLKEHQVKRGVAKLEHFSGSQRKKKFESTQNWSRQSLYAEGLTEDDI
jgi:hypothetical protein